MLVAVQTGCCIVLFEPIALEVAEQGWLNRYLILANDKPFVSAHWLVLLVPGMLLDLLGSESFIWISFHDLIKQVLTRFR